ncbi:unnamed protein product [Amoebophrya sp. A120]|nr:unnamed protein product [Amoebophrya sp. A120]|eukprot:GSA120T00022950001.1
MDNQGEMPDASDKNVESIKFLLSLKTGKIARHVDRWIYFGQLELDVPYEATARELKQTLQDQSGIDVKYLSLRKKFFCPPGLDIKGENDVDYGSYHMENDDEPVFLHVLKRGDRRLEHVSPELHFDTTPERVRIRATAADIDFELKWWEYDLQPARRHLGTLSSPEPANQEFQEDPCMVYVNVYDIKNLKGLNKVVEGVSNSVKGLTGKDFSFGGGYHADLEVYGAQFVFHQSGAGGACGSLICRPWPRNVPYQYLYKYSIPAGHTKFSFGEVRKAAITTARQTEPGKPTWTDEYYNPTRQNCVDYVVWLLDHIIPDWREGRTGNVSSGGNELERQIYDVWKLGRETGRPVLEGIEAAREHVVEGLKIAKGAAQITRGLMQAFKEEMTPSGPAVAE